MAGAKGTGGTPAGGTTGTGGTSATGGTTGTGGTSTASDGPCDIYATAGNACGAAYSTIRVLSKSYTGPLYQVRSGSSSLEHRYGRDDQGHHERGRLRRHRHAGHVLRHLGLHLLGFVRPVRERQRPQGGPRRPRQRRNVRGHDGLRVERDQEIADGQRAQGLRALHERTGGVSDSLERQGQERADGQHGPGNLRARRRYARRGRSAAGTLAASHPIPQCTSP